MALIDKLTAIANGFRSSRGLTKALTLDEMATLAAEKGSAEEIIKHAEIPDYVKEAALEVARQVRSVRTNDSVVFLAMSDSHYYGEQGESGVDTYVDSNGTQGNVSNLHGAMAAKILAYALDFDFMAHLGDATWGHKTTTSPLLNSQIDTLFGMLRESHANLPCFHAIGNHDTGMYYHNNMKEAGNTGIYTESGANLYNKFTALSESADTVIGGEEYGGYCYRDFANKKLRVFLLNTSEYHIYNQTDSGMLGSQKLWFANALLDLNDKSDAADWGFIVLCHYPADYGNAMPLSELLKAYVTGNGITIAHENGTNTTVNFTGKNNAKFIAQFHGHVHNFITSKLHSTATGTPVQFDAWRMCIPNGQYNRENYYTTVNGINFAEDTDYSKTAGTANDTSFVVNVISPSEEKIYSFCYGAGYDRVIGYGAVTYYSISRALTNVSTNNAAVSIEEGKSYSEVIMLNSGCDMKTISVTMGGVDISSSAITVIDGGYQIDIPEVEGNIVVTAKAQARPNFTNLVPLSINADGTDYNVDGDGYDNGIYLSSDTVVNKDSCTTTGFIPVKTGAKTIRIAGNGMNAGDGFMRILFYDSDFSYNATISAAHAGSNIYNGRVIEEDSTALTLEMYSVSGAGSTNGINCPYMRICAMGDGANLIVTVDEEITYGGEGSSDAEITYAVIQNLTNITSSNTSANVKEGDSFSATLTANSGYELGTVVVTMGGLDITSSAYSNGVISISSVTGNIVITATANAVQVSYTNQLPISTDASGNVFNGKGYKENTYISSGNEGTKNGTFTSGFIPCKVGDTLYFENVGMQNGQDGHRIAFYKSDKSYLSLTKTNNANFAGLTYGTDGNITKIVIPSGSYTNSTAFLRFCCSYIGDDSIVTVNEPIE